MKILKPLVLLPFFVFLSSCKVFVPASFIHKHKDYIFLEEKIKTVEAQHDTLKKECERKVEDLEAEKTDFRKDFFNCLNNRIDILSDNNTLLKKFDTLNERNYSLRKKQIRLQGKNRALREDSVQMQQRLMNLQAKYIVLLENADTSGISVDSLQQEHSSPIEEFD